MILQKIADVMCPKCQQPVRVYGEPGEPVEVGRPPRCPDCKTGLAAALQAVGVRP